MDDYSKLTVLKEILGPVDDGDHVLLSYLRLAGEIVLNTMNPYRERTVSEEPHAEEKVPDRYINNQVRIAVFLLNKRGAEGETQHIENGIHRNYKNGDVPSELLRDIIPVVGIPR